MKIFGEFNWSLTNTRTRALTKGSFRAKDHVIMGHEFSGTVAALSKSIKTLAVGDKVVVNPNSYCGTCLQCRKGHFNLCKTQGGNTALGIFQNGGWAEYCKVHVSSVFKIKDSIPLDRAALCEPISCIIHAYDMYGPIEPDSNILIVGGGIIGVLWCCILHGMGHRNVYVAEIIRSRREIVDKLKFGFVCESLESILSYKKLYPDWSVDVCIDCSGNANAMQDILPLLGIAAKFCVFGVAPLEARISISPHDIFSKELKIIGSVMNTNESFSKAIAVIQNLGHKYFSYDIIGIKTYSLSEHKEVFYDLQSKRYSKVVFEINRTLQ